MKMITKWCSVGFVGSLLCGCGLNSKNSDESGDKNKQESLKNFMLPVDYENVSTNLSPANYGMQFPNNTMNESEIQNALNEMNRNIGEVRSNLVTKLCKSSKQPKLKTLDYPSDLVTPFILLPENSYKDNPERHAIFDMKDKDNVNEESNKLFSMKTKVSQKDKTFYKSAVESIQNHENEETEKK